MRLLQIFPRPSAWLKALLLCLWLLIAFLFLPLIGMPFEQLATIVGAEWPFSVGMWVSFALPGLGMGLLSWWLKRWPQTRTRMGFRRRPWPEAAIGAGIMLAVAVLGVLFEDESLWRTAIDWVLLAYLYHLSELWGSK